ncbi:MAG: hypothetical protein Q4D21_09805 [Phascolarctobacterium sp.]|nr:hypothetical protein [Phascolarctobacterium sp.]
MQNKIMRAALCFALGILTTSASTGFAADELLAQTELNRGAEKVTAELWANPIKGGYMNDLTIIFKRVDKSIITAYKPTINGGYNSLLKPIKIVDKDGDEQLLLSVGQGTWNVPSDFRIIDFDKKGKVTEIFGGKESLGIVINAKASRDKLNISLNNGEVKDVKISKQLDDLEINRLIFDNLYSLTAYDFDKDGVDEIFLDQEIRARRNLVMDVGYMLKYDKDQKSWKSNMITLMANGVVGKRTTVNEGRAFNLGMFMPRKIVLPFGEGTYPEFSTAGFELENNVNKLLQKEIAPFLPKVFAGNEDLAFNVLRADEKLWVVQLIHGKKEFFHHHLNISPKNGELVKLNSILDVKNKKLLELMKKLCEESEAKFQGAIPNEWYIVGDNLFLCQMNAEGKEENIGFPLEKLNDFIIDKDWKVAKPKASKKDKDEKEETPEDKFWKKLLGEDKEDKKADEKVEKDSSEENKDRSEIPKNSKDKKNVKKNKKLTDESAETEKESKNKQKEETKP